MKQILFVFFVARIVLSMDLPSHFKTCQKSNPDYSRCLERAVQEAVVSLASGLKSFRILPIEPLAVDSVKIGKTTGSVSLQQEYKNIKLHGLTKGLQIANYSINWDNVILTSDAFNPQVDFVADYNLNGKILLLPIRGDGRSNITMYNLKSHCVLYGEKYDKNGETYMKVKKFSIKFKPDRVNLQFDNLFGGDTVLGEQMNRFINENSDLLFKELQAPYEETFGLVFAKISNEIFGRVPLKQIFPE